MFESIPTLPLRLNPSRRKIAFLFLVSLAFVVAGLVAARERPFLGYSGAAFFGLGIIVAAVNLLPGSSYLSLTREGFTYCSLFRSTFVSWKDVREFVPIRVHDTEMVGFNYVDGFPPQGVLTRMAKSIAGVDGELPDTYGVPAADLSKLLNAVMRRERGQF